MAVTNKDAMTPDPEVIHVDQSVIEAAIRMRDSDIGALFVVDGDELVGVISDRDVVARALTEAHDRDIMEMHVMDAMTKHVVAAAESESLDATIDLMMRHRIRRIAVLNDRDELVGVVSLSDVARSHDEKVRSETALRAIAHPDAHSKKPEAPDPAGGRAKAMEPDEGYATRPVLKAARSSS